MTSLFIIPCLLAVGGLAQEEYKNYAFTQVMSECLGENVYYGYLQNVANARKECEVEGLFIHERTPISGIFNPNSFRVHQVNNVIPTTFAPPHLLTGLPTANPTFHQSLRPILTTTRPPIQQPLRPILTTTRPPIQSLSPVLPGVSRRPNIQSFSPSLTPRPTIHSFQSPISPLGPNIQPLGNRRSPTDSVFGDTNVPVFTDSDLPFGPRVPSLRKKRALGLLYSSADVQDTIARVQAMVGNFTCVLRKLGVATSNLDINYDVLTDNALRLPVAEDLKKDLISSVGYCRNLMTCLPLDQLQSPLPHHLQRLMAYVKCEKDIRFKACLKHDLRKKLSQFNHGFVPGVTSDTETLLGLLVEAESVSELEFIL